jgi:hypothetical protein
MYFWQKVRRVITTLMLMSVISMSMVSLLMVNGGSGTTPTEQARSIPLALSASSIQSKLYTIATSGAGYTVTVVGSGVTVQVEYTGVYTIITGTPRWIFSGSVGVPLSHLALNAGTDPLGDYRELAFTYQGKVARQSSIRVYASRPVVLFSTTYLAAGSNTEPFPTFTSYPLNLFHLSYHSAFAVYGFNLNGVDGPWLFFDAHANSFVLSPAANFMVARTVVNSDNSISSGIDQRIGSLPRGFSHRTMLAFGAGINRTYDIWGHALTDLQGKIRPANDANVTLAKLGYWTDNGAFYYYKYIPSKGYAGTLEAIKRDFAQRGIPLGYMQLDSWWYPKGPSPAWNHISGGTYTYVADPTLFPQGLGAFQRQLGLPLVVHGRWIDPRSPYRSKYRISGNVPVDPNYWKTVMDYLRSSGVVTYEQDWLSAQARANENLTDPAAFLSGMANAASADGLTLQYCMADPYDFMQSTMYSNMSTARVSTDHFMRSKWDDFLYDSRFASALGVWPWSDVFMSTETDNLLLSTLSGGIVGVGDKIGTESRTNLMQVIRADGVIVKPDTSIVPADETYLADAQGANGPMVAAAYTYHTNLVTAYVFVYGRHGSQIATFTPAALGITGRAYVYNYFTRRGTVVDPGQSFSERVGGTTGSYYVVVPVGPSGIAFLGDAGKFVSLGNKRISQLSDNGTIQATVTFAPGEKTVTLHGYAPTMPKVSATSGSVSVVSYNSQTGLFSFSVSAGAANTATISISE